MIDEDNERGIYMLTEMTVEELKNLMVSAGESAVKRIERERNQRKMIVDAGKFFTDYEACGNRIDEDIAEILSRKIWKSWQRI